MLLDEFTLGLYFQGLTVCVYLLKMAQAVGFNQLAKLIRPSLPSTHCEAPVACTVTSRVFIQTASLFGGEVRDV